jgi:hypothetical protein
MLKRFASQVTFDRFIKTAWLVIAWRVANELGYFTDALSRIAGSGLKIGMGEALNTYIR